MWKVISVFTAVLLVFSVSPVQSQVTQEDVWSSELGSVLKFLTYGIGSLVFDVIEGKMASPTTHNQVRPEPVTPELVELGIGEYWSEVPSAFQEGAEGLEDVKSETKTLAINLYLDTKASVDSYNLNTNDSVCVGDKIKIKVNLSGEWFGKGGPLDSPPIVFVEDLDTIKKAIENKSFRTEVHKSFICSFGGTPGLISEDVAKEGFEHCAVAGNVICSPSCAFLSTEGLENDEDGLAVTKEGEVGFALNCTAECIMFINRENMSVGVAQWNLGLSTPKPIPVGEGWYTVKDAYGYMKIDEPLHVEENGTFGTLFTFKAEKGSPLPEVGIKAHIPDNTGSSFMARIEIENKGGVEVYIEEVEVTNADFEVLYSPASLGPGERSEVLVETAPTGGGDVDFNLKYRSDELGCRGKREFSSSANLLRGAREAGACTSDQDCNIGETCCAGSCRDSGTGICDDIDGDGVPETWVEV